MMMKIIYTISSDGLPTDTARNLGPIEEIRAAREIDIFIKLIIGVCDCISFARSIFHLFTFTSHTIFDLIRLIIGIDLTSNT